MVVGIGVLVVVKGTVVVVQFGYCNKMRKQYDALASVFPVYVTVNSPGSCLNFPIPLNVEPPGERSTTGISSESTVSIPPMPGTVIVFWHQFGQRLLPATHPVSRTAPAGTLFTRGILVLTHIETRLLVHARGGLCVKLMYQTFGLMRRMVWHPAPITT